MEKFQAFIDLKDIVKVELEQIKANELFLHVFLNCIGECKNEIYNKKVKEYKEQNKSMASAFFRILNSDAFKPFLSDLPSVAAKLNSFLEAKRKNLALIEGPPSSLTRIPFSTISSARRRAASCIPTARGITRSSRNASRKFQKSTCPGRGTKARSSTSCSSTS